MGQLERPVKITLAKGERRRDRVLSDGEWQRYIVEWRPALARRGNYCSWDGDASRRAIERVNATVKLEGGKELNHFQPYILRHTALTELAEAGCDVFTLARIAGHSSITITQRYVHPQADAIQRAFQQTAKTVLCAPPSQVDAGTAEHQVGTELGTAIEAVLVKLL